ncbi:hypothetical protein BCU68_14085 [Vibrio sp. 10N.286.49.B3]|uniref:LysM-like peptidoglycan-binding domain-containing protein n=1 Tax=Vibrio sp. 10N.286.49.B3 TaxID=1880855 RepID=UPI000C8570C4|nr:LysM-like peptidoglycan-binding domain-containing protein [Vibrio sp. 10N.286.49.B3]PMH42564.1 hypothetical protein BCU68_14085 [Vibrio sp. 10N.286.49.B3]
MNRRHKKKTQVSPFAALKQKIQSLDFSQLNVSDIGNTLVSRIMDVKQLWYTLPKLHRRGLTVLTPLVMLLLVFPSPSEPKFSTQPNTRVGIDINTQGLSQQQVTSLQTGSNNIQNISGNNSSDQPVAEVDQWLEYTVKKGDTLSKVFRTNKLSMPDLNALVKIEGNDQPLSQIKAGQLIRFKLATDGKLDILQLEKKGTSVMFFRLSDGGFGRSK